MLEEYLWDLWDSIEMFMCDLVVRKVNKILNILIFYNNRHHMYLAHNSCSELSYDWLKNAWCCSGRVWRQEPWELAFWSWYFGEGGYDSGYSKGHADVILSHPQAVKNIGTHLSVILLFIIRSARCIWSTNWIFHILPIIMDLFDECRKYSLKQRHCE